MPLTHSLVYGRLLVQLAEATYTCPALECGTTINVMEITNTAIEEFRFLWEQTYGEIIAEHQAREYADQLLKLLIAVYGPR